MFLVQREAWTLCWVMLCKLWKRIRYILSRNFVIHIVGTYWCRIGISEHLVGLLPCAAAQSHRRPPGWASFLAVIPSRSDLGVARSWPLWPSLFSCLTISSFSAHIIWKALSVVFNLVHRRWVWLTAWLQVDCRRLGSACVDVVLQVEASGLDFGRCWQPRNSWVIQLTSVVRLLPCVSLTHQLHLCSVFSVICFHLQTILWRFFYVFVLLENNKHGVAQGNCTWPIQVELLNS